ncbi:MAG: hypothetical protein H6741_32970 [Alphaproteobacteria bacterium]|nr:hypothetical protein [Alphaproteobacteria bacterium]
MDVRQLDEDTPRAPAASPPASTGAGRGAETIAPTALLHEAWGKVARGSYQSKAHFMAVAARAMRQILVDRAWARRAVKTAAPAPHDLFRVAARSPLCRRARPGRCHRGELRPPAQRMFTFGGMSAPEVAEGPSARGGAPGASPGWYAKSGRLTAKPGERLR